MKKGVIMNKWFYFNFIVMIFAIWKIATSSLLPHIIFGGIGLFLILFNWTRHAVFSTLRSPIPRQRKIKYANLSKRILPFHKWVGTTALIMIAIHAILIISQFGLDLSNSKMVIGLIGGFILLGIVLTGWMRLFRPTIRKRLFHLWLGLSMFFIMILHLAL